MKRSRRTRGRYRGGRRHVDLLIPTLVVLCVAAAITLYLVNENVVFTKDGAFFSRSDVSETTPSEVETNLVIEEAEKPEVPQVEPSKTETAPTRSYFISIDKVKNTELFDVVLSEVVAIPSVNTLVLEVKAEDGMLAFAIDSPLGAAAAVGGDDEALRAVISKAREKGYKVALYLSAFKDNETARKNQPYSTRTENKIIWIDGTNTRWLSAYSENAREYVIDTVKKACSFSPDEIILSNVSFPAVGKTQILFYEKELGTKRDAIKSFIADVRAACGETKLSAVYENYNDACISMSGQNAEDFKDGFDSLYVKKNSDYYTKSGAESGIPDAVVIDATAKGESFMIRK